MAKIQIKSETRKDLSFFPSSFEDYIPKDNKVCMLNTIVRSMDSKPLLSTYANLDKISEKQALTYPDYIDTTIEHLRTA